MNAPVDVSFFARAAKPLNSYRKFWASRFATAPFLPMRRKVFASASLPNLTGKVRRHSKNLAGPTFIGV
jgi:hypothetical protein